MTAEQPALKGPGGAKMWVINWTLSQVSDSFFQGSVNAVVDRIFKASTLTPQAVLLAGQLTRHTAVSGSRRLKDQHCSYTLTPHVTGTQLCYW